MTQRARGAGSAGIGALVTVAALAAGAGSAQAEVEVTLRCQHFLPPTSSVPAFFMAPWAEAVEEASDGRIDVQLFPAMQLGGAPPALYDQIRDGVIDCGWTLPAYTPGRFPETEAMELPFMTTLNAEESSRAAWEFSEQHLIGSRFGDIHIMAVHVHGPGVIHMSGGAIEEVADFEGKQLRGPSRQANALLESLGATTVGLPVPAFPEALSRGVVDGGVIPWEVVPTLRVEELAEYHTQVGGERAFYNTFFLFGMNRAVYEGLPEDLRAVIDAFSGVEASAWAGRAMDQGDDIAQTAIAARGNTIVTLEGETLEAIQTVGAEVTQAWIAEMDGLGLDGAQLVEDARAAVERNAGTVE